jgi:hypothetical protein
MTTDPDPRRREPAIKRAMRALGLPQLVQGTGVVEY